MASTTLRRAGLVAAGAALGLGVLALALWLYLQTSRVDLAGEEAARLRVAVPERLVLPREVLERAEITGEGPIHIALRGVVVRGEAGDTILASPEVVTVFDPASLAGRGPIVFPETSIESPVARLVRSPAGDWNVFAVLADAADDGAAGDEPGRPLTFRDVAITGGHASVALPGEPPPADTAGFVTDLALPRIRRGAEWYQLYAFDGVNARLPVVRIGAMEGWRVEVAALGARLREPELGITRLAGWVEAEGEDGVAFGLRELRFGESVLAGQGSVRFADAGLVYDVELGADPLLLRDLQPILPTLPDEGVARFAMRVETREDGRTALAVREASVDIGESHVGGSFTLLAGGGAVPTFGETRIELDPLQLVTLHQLGLVDSLPALGQIRGVISTDEAAEGALAVDVTARLVPRDQPDAEPSVIVARGGLRPGTSEVPLRLQGLRVQFQPLYLAALVGAFPEQRERLRGELSGGITLSGTPQSLRAEGGELVYQVGAAAPSRLTGITGAITLDPLTYELSASAQPLALSTLTELVPSLPFRAATLAGPIRLAGNAESARFGADLRGAAGAIRLSGTATPGAPPRFDVTGRLEAFTASEVMTGELPVEGPVSGTFTARGAADDFAFDVDFTQTAGRLALEGRVRLPGGPPEFAVAGEVSQFRIGALIGRPGLFPSPLSGAVDVRGGAGRPYRFDVELRGEPGVFDLEGSYDPTDIPTYSARGRVEGLDLRRIPLAPGLPQTSINATIALDGRGTSLETLAGSLSFDADESVVGGVPVDAARAEVEVRDGVLVVDTLLVAIRESRLAASGMWGLARPAPESLRYSLRAPDLAMLSRIVLPPQMIQPRVEGSVQLDGWVAGSMRSPLLAAVLRGEGLRYQEWQAATLGTSLAAARTDALGWRGEGELTGTGLVLAGGERLQTLRLEVDGSQTALAVTLEARRDADADVALTGLIELEGRVPRAVALDSLVLRAAGATWRLADRTRLQWGAVDGVLIQDLRLERTGDATAWIQVDGTLPPTGRADLAVRAGGVSLEDVRRFAPRAPDIAGVLALDAVLEGPVDSPELSIDLRVDSLRYQGTEVDSIVVAAAYAGREMIADARVWSGGRRLALVEASLPMVVAIADLIPDFEFHPDEPLSARLSADSLPLHLLTAAVPQLAEGEGQASAEVVVGGTLSRPQLRGWARVRNGAVSVVPTGTHLHDIRGELTLEENVVRVDSLRARSDGTIALGGTINFQEGAAPRVFLDAQFEDFLLMELKDAATLKATGRVNLSGQLPGPVLTGRLVFNESTITIPDLDEQQGVEITDVDVGQIGADTLDLVATGPAFLRELRIDALEVGVGESAWLVSDDARVQITGELIVFRVGEDLRVYGALQAERGTYALEVGSITREFEIVSGRVQFFGTADLNPSLDIVAANRVRTTQGGQDLTILVNLSGTLRSPRIQLSSDTPTPLSESDLFSYLIFGQPSFELGGAAGVFAQQIFVQEVLGGLFATGLEQPLLQAGICDYVRVLPAPSTFGDLLSRDVRSTLSSTLGGAILECGKEVGNDFFLTAETGIGALFGDAPNWALGLEWQIADEWLWELTYGPVRRDLLFRLINPDVEYQVSTDFRRRWEYGGSSRPSLLEIPPEERMPPGEVAP